MCPSGKLGYATAVVHATLLLALLAPFVFFAGRDLRFHLRHRRPSRAEDVVHLLLGVAQVAVIVNAFRADLPRLVLAAVLVGFFGAIDELAFHRELPATESDLHAKAHFALFVFVAGASALAIFPSVDPLLQLARGGAR